MALHLKQRLQQLAEPVLTEYGMRFFKGTGDGFLATFTTASKTVNAAIELVGRIKHRNARTTNPPIHYRIALHYGETWGISTGGQDIHGNDVNITFRIEGAQQEAFGATQFDLPRMDRILCSRALLDEIRGKEGLDVPAETALVGSATLKGIHDPVEIHLVKDRGETASMR
jgi:class 3 adenylate cyclase